MEEKIVILSVEDYSIDNRSGTNILSIEYEIPNLHRMISL
jgi:hypothetical protein